MARTSIFVALMVVAGLVVQRGEARGLQSLRQQGNCPDVTESYFCQQPFDQCESAADCREGDECCKAPCGYFCHNEETGFYHVPSPGCREAPFQVCSSFYAFCSSRWPCDVGKACCRVGCQSHCFDPVSE